MIERGDVFEDRHVRPAERHMGAEARRRTVVDARRIDADRHDPALLHEPLCRQRRHAGELQLRHRSGAGRGGAEVGRSVGPLQSPARAHQHDDVHELPAVRRLPGHEIVRRHLVDRVCGTLRRHVHHDGVPHEAFHGNGVARLPRRRKMPRRVEVRAAVFGRREPVGGVVVALGRGAVFADA